MMQNMKSHLINTKDNRILRIDNSKLIPNTKKINTKFIPTSLYLARNDEYIEGDEEF